MARRRETLRETLQRKAKENAEKDNQKKLGHGEKAREALLARVDDTINQEGEEEYRYDAGTVEPDESGWFTQKVSAETSLGKLWRRVTQFWHAGNKETGAALTSYKSTVYKPEQDPSKLKPGERVMLIPVSQLHIVHAENIGGNLLEREALNYESENFSLQADAGSSLKAKSLKGDGEFKGDLDVAGQAAEALGLDLMDRVKTLGGGRSPKFTQGKKNN